MSEGGNKIRQTVVTELRRSHSPYIYPAWRTSLFLIEGLPVDEALEVIAKLAKSGQRGFDVVSKKLEQTLAEA